MLEFQLYNRSSKKYRTVLTSASLKALTFPMSNPRIHGGAKRRIRVVATRRVLVQR
jgi:hypothetical protein